MTSSLNQSCTNGFFILIQNSNLTQTITIKLCKAQNKKSFLCFSFFNIFLPGAWVTGCVKHGPILAEEQEQDLGEWLHC